MRLRLRMARYLAQMNNQYNHNHTKPKSKEECTAEEGVLSRLLCPPACSPCRSCALRHGCFLALRFSSCSCWLVRSSCLALAGVLYLPVCARSKADSTAVCKSAALRGSSLYAICCSTFLKASTDMLTSLPIPSQFHGAGLRRRKIALAIL